MLSCYHSEGNTFFKNKQYKEAIQKYTDAIALDQGDVTFYSNRSACYAALNMWNEAAEDGRQCIKTDKSFVKGYFRQALGLQNLGNLEAALDSVKCGLGIDSQNADLKKKSREIEEAQKVKAAIAQAQSQEAERDYGAAVKTIRMTQISSRHFAAVNNYNDKVKLTFSNKKPN